MTIAVIALVDGISDMINMYYNGVVLIDELRKSRGLHLVSAYWHGPACIGLAYGKTLAW